MNSIEIWVIARAVERVLIDVAAFVSIYFGYKLFRAGVNTLQAGDIKFLRWQVTLKQVGPGVFFALFGTIVLSVSVLYGVNFEQNLVQGDKANVASAVKGRFIGHGDDELAKSRVIALQAASDVARCGESAPCPPMMALRRSALYLETLRIQILQEHFQDLGTGVVAFWEKHKEQFASGQIKDTATLERLKELQPWFEGG